MFEQARPVLTGAVLFSICLGPVPVAWAAPPASAAQPNVLPASSADTALAAACEPEAMRKIASSLTSAGITIHEIEEAPKFAGGTHFVAATASVPAFCQVQGSFVTNPKTGKTANFLATLPVNWNGKYLQLGCSGHCGNFAVSNPAQPFVTITTQGYPNQIIQKGYAAFATDEGHVGFEGGTWAAKGPGKVDQDAITDFYYRADLKLAGVGKQLTAAFYGSLSGKPEKIDFSYFDGCSGGGRDAFVAASYFPEQFDGIIGGSAYDLLNRGFHAVGTGLATLRTPDARVSEGQLALLDTIVKAQCDGLDGVKDGLIQNPAACNFNPARDLPRCASGQAGDQCFTPSQIETVSVVLTAATDEAGHVVQPGYSVSELASDFAPPRAPKDPSAAEPWPDNAGQDGGLWALGNATLKMFVHGNDPAFSSRSVIAFRQGGDGQVTNYRMIIPAAEVSFARAATSPGVGHFPEKAAKLIRLDRKFLIWHNFSDEKLSPYSSINYYKKLARLQGGYAKLQKNVRLFMIPGSGHCSMSGVGPNNFDALTAIENWVEKGQAPEALLARLYNPKSPMIDPKKTPLRSMPLCKFPEMAHYSGRGDVKDAANWSCPPSDTSLLQVGESGKQAGVLQ